MQVPITLISRATTSVITPEVLAYIEANRKSTATIWDDVKSVPLFPHPTDSEWTVISEYRTFGDWTNPIDPKGVSILQHSSGGLLHLKAPPFEHLFKAPSGYSKPSNNITVSLADFYVKERKEQQELSFTFLGYVHNGRFSNYNFYIMTIPDEWVGEVGTIQVNKVISPGDADHNDVSEFPGGFRDAPRVALGYYGFSWPRVTHANRRGKAVKIHFGASAVSSSHIPGPNVTNTVHKIKLSTGDEYILSGEGNSARCIAEVTLPPEDLKAAAVTLEGVQGPWVPIHIAPVPFFDLAPSIGEFGIDASKSFSLTADKEIKTYRSNFSTSSQPAFNSLQSGAFDSDNDFNYSLDLWVDDETAPHAKYISRFTRSVLVEANQRSDAFIDPHGVMWSAVNSTLNGVKGVQVYSFAGDTSTRSAAAWMPNLTNPSLYQHNGDSTTYLFAQDRTTKAWRLYNSNDDAATFTLMANSPFDTNYSRVVSQPIEGGFVACGVKKNTAQNEVWFSLSWDGLTWEPMVKAGDLAASAQKALSIFQEDDSGGSRLRITNGFDKTWISDSMGASWEVA